MVTVVTGRAQDHSIDPQALNGMFRLRDRVFHQRLNWEVESRGGLERDEYDDLGPVYLIARSPGRGVAGCMRLLPTTGPYMLRDTFPQLLRGEEGPRSPRVWDISRLAVIPPKGTMVSGVQSSVVMLELVRALVDHAFETGIDSYVAVISVALERIIRRIGLPLRRFGDGQAQRVGDVLAVACWIDMTEEARRAVTVNARDAA